MDIVPNQLLEYTTMRGMDYGVHPYMHNIMTMEAYQLYLHYCSNTDINKIFNHPAKKIIHSMKEPRKFEDKYLILHKKKNK